MPIPGLLLFLELLCQPHPDLHTVDEAGAFMVAAEGADWIHDLIHLPERHTVHQFVQLKEIFCTSTLVCPKRTFKTVSSKFYFLDPKSLFVRCIIFCEIPHGVR